MARKGNHQRNGLDRKSANHKIRVSEPLDGSLPVESEKVGATKLKVVNGEELPNSSQPSSPSVERGEKTKHATDEKKSHQKSRKESRKKGAATDGIPGLNQSAFMSNNSADILGDLPASKSSELRGEDKAFPGNDSSSKNRRDSSSCLDDGRPNVDEMKNSRSFDNVVGRNLGASAFTTLKVAAEWIQKQKPLFTSIMTILLDAGKYVQLKTEKACPIVWKWLVHFRNLMLLISMLWLDCCIRGLLSFLRLGTTSFFAVIWCSVLSVIAMIGFLKFSIVMVVGAIVAFFASFTLAILVVTVITFVFLLFYGSFWTTGIVILVAGLGFALRHEYLSLLIATIYSIYCAKTYVGWLGLVLGLNLSFISSDVLVYFLKNNINEYGRSNRPQEQTANGHGQSPRFFGESMHATSETASGSSTDRSPGVPSTSGADETTPGDEVVRLLNCTDHYSALGLSRYENVDVSLLKREYRRKAMLVHPDKNMGNEKAAEAFKKLQNAYEVLLDSFKRKAYDDELRSEELLNLFRRSQSLSQKNGRHGPFTSSFSRSEANCEDHHEDSRRIACKKCGNFHLWIHTNKSKSKARWCQECKDFHQAKDGDGWVEQSSQPFFFGLLQKVDAPTAYVCAESRIYDATEWFICQGMRCPANTHKPSFHVNTSATTKHGFSKGSSPGQRGTGPSTNDVDEIMTEEEFMEFLQKAMKSGMFDTAGTSSSTDRPSTRAGNSFKTSGSGSNNKKKRKGKKQW